MKKLLHWLGIEKRSEYVEDYFATANFRSSIYMSIVIIVLELWMLGSLCYRWVTGDDSRTTIWYVEHLIWYVVFLATAIVMIICAVRYINAVRNKVHNRLTGFIVMLFFSGIALYFGISISYSDYTKGEQILCFVMMVIFVVGLLNWRPIISIITSGLVFILFYCLMAGAPGVPITYATKVNYFTFWISIVMLSLSVYHQRMAEALKDERLEMLSVTDELTGIPNMAFFREKSEKALKVENIDKLIFLFFDISNFKVYNEKYGFEAGNALLKATAERIAETFKDDIYARVSDDHFIVLTDRTGAQEKAEEIGKNIADNHSSVNIRIRIGAYQPTDRDEDPAIACDHARYACAMLKKDFDHSYSEYDKAMDDGFKRRQYIVNHIDEAIANHYIEPYYQPIVNASDRTICNLEALARWNDPTYGFLSPADFIPALEEYRQIYKLDKEILRLVCEDIHNHLEGAKNAIPVSVNFSRLDFELMDMVKELPFMMHEYEVPHEYLHVEITESALVEGEDSIRMATAGIRKKGIELWLDDFGAGYSSLNVLKDFSFDMMKIDLLFLKNIEEDEKSRKIVRSIVEMSHQIGMMTLAEGVETEKQADILSEMGCDRLQGYYFGKPKPVKEFWENEEV